MGMSGAVKKATEKQTAAPTKHAPKPISLKERDDSHARGREYEIQYVPVPSGESKVSFLLV